MSTTETEDMRRAAQVLRDRRPDGPEGPFRRAVAAWLYTAAGRLEAHPGARGPMTQRALHVAAIVNGETTQDEQ